MADAWDKQKVLKTLAENNHRHMILPKASWSQRLGTSSLKSSTKASSSAIAALAPVQALSTNLSLPARSPTCPVERHNAREQLGGQNALAQAVLLPISAEECDCLYADVVKSPTSDTANFKHQG